MLFGEDVLGTSDRIVPVWPQAVPESRRAPSLLRQARAWPFFYPNLQTSRAIV